MRETWYLMEDGSVCDPKDIEFDGKGYHKGGVKVAMKGDVPHTTGVDVEAEHAKAKKPEPKPASEDREVTADKPKRKYKTRG